MALDMVLNTPLSHKLHTQYYNTDVCKDPNDYRSSRPEVFCKKCVLRYFANFEEIEKKEVIKNIMKR